MRIPNADYEKPEAYWLLLGTIRTQHAEWREMVQRAWNARHMCRRLNHQPNYHGMCYAYRKAARAFRHTIKQATQTLATI